MTPVAADGMLLHDIRPIRSPANSGNPSTHPDSTVRLRWITELRGFGVMLYEIPENPVPEGADPGFLELPGDIRLRYACWRPESGQPNGTVCLLQGRGEYIEKYYETVEELRRRKFAVAALDWRGQGGSTRLLLNPRKAHIRSFSQYDEDLVRFIRDVVLPDCPPPYYALAHSMGGTVVLRSLKVQNWFDRVVCTAPMIGLRRVFLPWPFVRIIAEVLTWIGAEGLYIPGGGDRFSDLKPFETNPLTTDRERYERNRKMIETYPDLGTCSPTIGWLAAAKVAMAQLREGDLSVDLKVPVLIVQAGHDQIVSNEAAGALSGGLPAGGNIFIDAARHEILMERKLIREQFWAAFDAFVPGTTVSHLALRQSSAYW